MSNWRDVPELVAAKKADLLKLKEEKIDKLIQETRELKQQQKSFTDFQNESRSISVFGYITKSSKALFSLMQNNSNVKRSKSADSAQLSAIIENQKILASLIIQHTKNKKQLNEMISNDE